MLYSYSHIDLDLNFIKKFKEPICNVVIERILYYNGDIIVLMGDCERNKLLIKYDYDTKQLICTKLNDDKNHKIDFSAIDYNSNKDHYIVPFHNDVYEKSFFTCLHDKIEKYHFKFYCSFEYVFFDKVSDGYFVMDQFSNEVRHGNCKKKIPGYIDYSYRYGDDIIVRTFIDQKTKSYKLEYKDGKIKFIHVKGISIKDATYDSIIKKDNSWFKLVCDDNYSYEIIPDVKENNSIYVFSDIKSKVFENADLIDICNGYLFSFYVKSNKLMIANCKTNFNVSIKLKYKNYVPTRILHNDGKHLVVLGTVDESYQFMSVMLLVLHSYVLESIKLYFNIYIDNIRYQLADVDAIDFFANKIWCSYHIEGSSIKHLVSYSFGNDNVLEFYDKNINGNIFIDKNGTVILIDTIKNIIYTDESKFDVDDYGKIINCCKILDEVVIQTDTKEYYEVNCHPEISLTKVELGIPFRYRYTNSHKTNEGWKTIVRFDS